MNIQIYTRSGSHYHVYDDASQWELVQTYTNFTYLENGRDPRRIAFPPQHVGAQQTRAFYIAIVETYGEIRPLLNGMMAGSNYLNGAWAQDDRLSIMEGVKFYGLSSERPFGNGTDDSGVFMHQGPGGTSYNMKDATIRYRAIDTIAPSVSPSISQVPSFSQVPSSQPTLSNPPSIAPTTSSRPTGMPSGQPSISISPSEYPSMTPTAKPSTSIFPSGVPSVTSWPTDTPTSEPSRIPSMHPSESPTESFQPSNVPSLEPSDSPSLSQMPSFAPSISVMPSLQRFHLDSESSGSEQGAFGVMFEVIPNRAINVETFQVATFGGTYEYQFHVFSKPGSWAGAESNAGSWAKIGEYSVTTNQNPVRLSSTAIDSVTIYAGQTQSFYIACTSRYFKVRQESSSTASTNNDVSLYTGSRKFPSSGLFSSGSPGYRFQGKIFYSQAIDPPSLAPSEVPSDQPSISISPTSYSNSPSNIPSLSLAPSDSPSTENPTTSPTLLPSTSFAPTVGQAKVQFVIPSKISIGGFDTSEVITQAEIATVVTIVAPSIAELVRANLNTGQRLRSVTIISINGVLVDPGTNTFTRRHLVSRRLEGDIDIEYEIALEELCSSQTCDNAQEIANTLYDSVTETMQEEIDSGVFENTLEATAAALGVVFEAEVSQPIWSDLVVTVLALLSIWYPVWIDGKYCENDGNQPWYMKQNPSTWLYNTRDGCCSRYYSYDYAACMGVDESGAIGFYPAWDGTLKCLNDGDIPSYMRHNSNQWVYDDIDSCCQRYYGWDYNSCIAESGGNPTNTFTSKWYVNHADEICQQDCPEDSGGFCGGLVDSWKTLFDSPAECCENRLPWTSTSICEALSTDTTPTGSSKWYVDWQLEKCVEDCDSSIAGTCGGIVTSGHVTLHDSADSCCSDKLSWVPSQICEADSMNTPATVTGSNEWYVDYRLGLCVQDCKGSSPCGGLAKNWDETYGSAGQCCAQKLWWLDGLTSCVLT